MRTGARRGRPSRRPGLRGGGHGGPWVDQGIQVSYCLVTDGDAGGHDPTVPRDQIPALRRAEQTAAAKEVGVEDLIWLGYPDGRVMASLDLRRDIARVIRQVRPNGCCHQSPQRYYVPGRRQPPGPSGRRRGHDLCAVYPDSRNPFAFPELAEEGCEAHVVDEVFIMGGPDPDTFVDVTETFDRKVAALRAHRSQTAQHENLEGFLRTWLASNGEQAGLPPADWPKSSGGWIRARSEPMHPWPAERRRAAQERPWCDAAGGLHNEC